MAVTGVSTVYDYSTTTTQSVEQNISFTNKVAEKYALLIDTMGAHITSIEKTPYGSLYFHFVHHVGEVVRIDTRYNSSMDMETYDATVAVVDEHGITFKSVPCSGNDTVDAPQEVIQAYKEFLTYVERRRYVNGCIKARNEDVKRARGLGFNNRFDSRYRTLVRKIGLDDVGLMADLATSFRNNRLRSDFKKSLAKQIIQWVENEENAYAVPLSPKQREFLIPKRYY